ncbi:alpha/beta-hydrolase [Marasmius fiardii PR-910]|nr:alpha/beta-hydrolase [Marasmius fiardii PR-910]
MLYDSTPQYEHFAHLPKAKEPFKGLYVFQRLFTTLLLVPYWVFKYLILPRSYRPRPSWSIRQIVFVNFTRRIYRVTEVAGVHWGTRNPDEEPGHTELKETRFEWAPPLEQRLRRGVVVDRYGKVPFKRVGTFVWPKERPVGVMDPKCTTEQSSSEDDIPVVGIYMHGGGYCQMSAHENARTSHIPRRLMKDKLFSEIYAVEYRLLQHAPLPAVIIDAATVYAHVVKKYYLNVPSPPTSSSPPNGSNTAIPALNGQKKCKIVLLGDSSGGNLVLALARWIRDEEQLPLPDGLLLFSPSCDASHAFPASTSFYIPRPNASTDYLTDTPEPRALLQRTFLGFKRHPQGDGWDAWEKENSERHRMALMRLGSAGATSALSLGRGLMRTVSFGTLPTINPGSSTSTLNDDLDDTEKAKIQAENDRLMLVVHSEYVSPASPKVLKRWGHPVDMYDGSKLCECKGDLDDTQWNCEHLKDTDRNQLAMTNSEVALAGGTKRKNHNGRRDAPTTVFLRTRGGHDSDTDTVSTMTPDNSPLPPHHVPVVAQMQTLDEERSLKPEGLENTRSSDSAGKATSSVSSEVMLPAGAAYIPSQGQSADTDSHHTRTESKASSSTAVANHVPPRITITPFDGEGEEFSTPRRHLRTRAGFEIEEEMQSTPNSHYALKYPQFEKLFEGFPKTLILIGDAERLTVEVNNLGRAMARDLDGDDSGGKRVKVRWIKDAVHDVYIIPPGWWDEKEKDAVWEDVKAWMKAIRDE